MKIDVDSIRLRHLARSDAPAIRAGLEDGVLARNMMNIPFPFHVGAEYEFIERVSKNGARGIVGYVDGIETLLGTCGIHLPFDDAKEADFEVGYMVFQKYWSNGVGTRAIELLISTVDVDATIAAGVMHDNPASLRVFEKLGFVATSESVCPSKGRGGEEVPTTVFILNQYERE